MILILLCVIEAVSLIDTAACISGYIVNLTPRRVSYFRMVYSITVVAIRHATGCSVSGTFIKWEDMTNLQVDLPRSTCLEGSRMRFKFPDFDIHLARMSISAYISRFGRINRLFLSVAVEGIVVGRDLDGCRVAAGGDIGMYPWWGITEAQRIVFSDPLQDAYCNILHCRFVNKQVYLSTLPSDDTNHQ